MLISKFLKRLLTDYELRISESTGREKVITVSLTSPAMRPFSFSVTFVETTQTGSTWTPKGSVVKVERWRPTSYGASNGDST